MSEELLKIFQESGALLSGHFELSSGRHSARYLQCALLLQHPTLSEKLCGALAERFRKTGVTVVVGPAIGGIVISFETAKALGARSIYAERESDTLRFRRNFSIQRGEKVLVVEDVVTTGGSTQELISLVRTDGGEVVGVGALVDRSGGKARYDVPFEALLKIEADSFLKEECPFCKKGLPLTKPGSRPSTSLRTGAE